MTTYRVRHNSDRFQPSRWVGDYVRRFGERNEGVLVEAESPEAAVRAFATAHNLNPWYLVAVAAA